MKYVPFTLAFVFLSMFAKAQKQQPPTGAIFRCMNLWSNMSTSTLSARSQPAIAIDSASGVVTIRVADSETAETMRIYDLNGNLLFERPLQPGNNIITLTGVTRRVFVFCVECHGTSLYSMKIARV